MPYRDKDKRREYNRLWMRKRRESYFNGKSCAWCGDTEDLELDHIDPNMKTSHRIWSWSEERRAAELAKCQPLCTPCHMQKTMSEKCTAKHGTISMHKLGCRCDPCKLAHNQNVNEYRYRKGLRHRRDMGLHSLPSPQS